MTPIGKLASTAIVSLVLVGRPALAQDASCPAHTASHAGDHAGVDSRGDRVMGFDHEKTTHHFLLAQDGGSIEVTANSAEDAESRNAIRSHLPHIAKMFSEGNFEAPMLVHDRVLPGVPALQSHKGEIAWKYEDLPAGGRVVATTRNKEALSALHEFLRFQISDHRTGDPGTVPDPAEGAKRR